MMLKKMYLCTSFLFWFHMLVQKQRSETMAYDEKPKTAAKPHNLSLEDRSRLSVTGVEDV